jgi:type I restriction enzyme S subunit
MSALAYPSYRATPHRWLQQLPSHWSLVPLRHLVECLDGQRVPLNAEERATRQGDVPYWGAGSVVDHLNQHLFNEPLVLLGEDGAPFFDRTRPVAFFITGKVWPNNHIHVLRSRPTIEAKFLAYFLNAVDYADFIEGSTRDKLTQAAMNRIPIGYPPLDEQRAIANFLDRETAKIDALVAEQERMTKLLEEKRRAVINNAVTKGIDPNASMKDSGVAWLGAVPSHWEVRALRTLGTLLKGRGGTKEDASDEGVQCVRYGDLYMFHRSHIRNARTKIPKTLAPNYTPLHYGDLIFAASGEKIDEIGKSAVNLITEEAYCGGDAIILRPNVPVHPEFLGYVADCQMAAAQKASMGRGTTVKHIYPDELRHLLLSYPPVDEQQAIAAFLDRETANIDALFAEQQRLIELLSERRSALITAAVTGQIDVRSEIDEGHSLDDVKVDA